VRYLLLLLFPLSLVLSGFSKRAGDPLPGCLKDAYRNDNAFQNWYIDNRCGGEIKVYFSSETIGPSSLQTIHECKVHALVVQTFLKDVVSIDNYEWTNRTASSNLRFCCNRKVSELIFS
jgi:hypothetical protein